MDTPGMPRGGDGVQVIPSAGSQISKLRSSEGPSGCLPLLSHEDPTMFLGRYPQKGPENNAPFSVLLYSSNCFSHELPYLLWNRRFLLIGNNSEAPRGFFKMFCESSQKIIGTLRQPFPLPTQHPDLG